MSSLTILPVKERAEKVGIETVQELATRTGLTYPTALKWWHGKVEMIHLDTLERMLDVLKCEPGDLIVRKT